MLVSLYKGGASGLPSLSTAQEALDIRVPEVRSVCGVLPSSSSLLAVITGSNTVPEIAQEISS